MAQVEALQDRATTTEEDVAIIKAALTTEAETPEGLSFTAFGLMKMVRTTEPVSTLKARVNIRRAPDLVAWTFVGGNRAIYFRVDGQVYLTLEYSSLLTWAKNLSKGGTTKQALDCTFQRR